MYSTWGVHVGVVGSFYTVTFPKKNKIRSKMLGLILCVDQAYIPRDSFFFN